MNQEREDTTGLDQDLDLGHPPDLAPDLAQDHRIGTGDQMARHVIFCLSYGKMLICLWWAPSKCMGASYAAVPKSQVLGTVSTNSVL